MTTRIFAWNPNGIRALIRNGKEELKTFINEQRPDIVFFPETKGNPNAETQVNKDLQNIFDSAAPNRDWKFYHSHCQSQPGRHGNAVAIATDKINIHDIRFGFSDKQPESEGRVIALCYSSDCDDLKSLKSLKRWAIGVYVPNASSKLVRLQHKLDWLKEMQQFIQDHSDIPLLVIGDINVAPDERDLCNPASNENTPGYTLKERQAYAELMKECGLVDVWRAQNPIEKKTQGIHGAYTFWNTRTRARDRNIGWRIDLCLARGFDNIGECVVCPQYKGSDHCPIGISLGD